jgi:hypothetical protein
VVFILAGECSYTGRSEQEEIERRGGEGREQREREEKIKWHLETEVDK